ncbi:MAG: GNAT family N-acetyltransferase [Micrococcales bacterium]|nr:GNAT family N-acetyltransferase [Micrococcales bacterium]
MSDPLCRLTIGSREAVALAPALVEGSADMLGLSTADRVRLRALTVEVLDAVLRDAFGPDDPVDLDIEVLRDPGDMTLVLRDRGAPLDFGTAYPPRVAELIRLGFADGLTFANEGRAGNRTEISKRLRYETVSEDEQFIAETESDPTPAPTVGEDGQVVVDIRPMTLDDVVGVARLFYRCYGYTVSYAPVVYEPERLAEMVQSGRHLATVAVSPDGRIVGHLASEVHDPDATTGKIGLLAVDPGYRRHGLSLRIGFAHVTRLLEKGFVGQYTEAVTVHLGSQKAALTGGGHEVGLLLAAQSNDLDFRGFDSDDRVRKAVMLFYGSFGKTPPRECYVPPIYREVVERIYSEGKLPRTVHSQYERNAAASEAKSRFRLSLRHETGVAFVYVEDYGEDFLENLQEQVRQLRMNRFELILVVLPLGDPATSYFGSGLQEIGLSFSGIYPEYADGDVLVLQNLNNVEVRPEEINVASDMGTYLRDFVLADYKRAAERVAQRERSRAHMARIYEALD